MKVDELNKQNLVDAIKYIKNIALRHKDSENVSQLQSTLNYINNMASNSINAKYDEFVEMD